MTPAPGLRDLIETVERDASGADVLTLLGLFAQPEAFAARALSEAGVDRPAVEARILETLPRQPEALVDNPPYIPQASDALGDTPAARILAGLGVSPPAIRARLLEMVGAATAGKAGPQGPTAS
jgi:hypothetical protein